MKKRAYMIVTMITLMIVVGLSHARAQSIRCDQVRASIPFSFNLGNKTMAAGEYTIGCVSPGSGVKALILRQLDGRTSAMVSTDSVSGKAGAAGRLVFHRYGDQYFFAQLWWADDSNGLEAPASRRQKKLELELAGKSEKRESVTIAARR